MFMFTFNFKQCFLLLEMVMVFMFIVAHLFQSEFCLLPPQLLSLFNLFTILNNLIFIFSNDHKLSESVRIYILYNVLPVLEEVVRDVKTRFPFNSDGYIMPRHSGLFLPI
jgi:hypothetical protein